MKIKVVKVNQSALLEKLKGCADLFKTIGAKIEDVPAEQEIYLDTKHITRIDSILPDSLSQGMFCVKMDDDPTPLCIKNDCFDRLLDVWMREN